MALNFKNPSRTFGKLGKVQQPEPVETNKSRWEDNDEFTKVPNVEATPRVDLQPDKFGRIMHPMFKKRRAGLNQLDKPHELRQSRRAHSDCCSHILFDQASLFAQAQDLDPASERYGTGSGMGRVSWAAYNDRAAAGNE